MKKMLLIVGVLLVLALLFFPRFFILHFHDKKMAAIAEETNVPIVKVLKMHPRMQPIRIVLPSYLDAINVTPIWARVNGYLNNFLVDLGDKVAEGDLLAVIDAPDVDAALERAEGELSFMIAKQEIAKITAARWTRLYEFNRESVSREEVDVKIADYEAAVANVEAAIGNINYWKAMKGFKNIYAPFNGIITSRTVDIGSLINLGSENDPSEFFMHTQKQELFQIACTDTLRAFVDVPQSLFYLVKDGLDVEVTIWQYPEKKFHGIINRNTQSLNPRTRTLLTQVNIDNSAGELVPGLYAEVKFEFQPQKKTFIIPVGALVVRNGPTYVCVVKNNIVHYQEVKIGVDDGKTLQIIDGLKPNDTILFTPTAQILDGMKVAPIYISEEEERMLFGPSTESQGNDAIMG